MKELTLVVFCVVACFLFGKANADEYGENDYTGNVAVEATAAPAAEGNVAAPSAEQTDDNGVKCFWRYRWYRSYWYTPVVYYYTPCTYYYTYYRYYSYSYRYVRFYKSADVKSATNDMGVLMDEAPKAGTPLAAHGIEKGDVITHIDGRAITNPEQVEKITKDSNLVILKANGGTNAAGAVAPQAPAVAYEYGANEY